MAAAIFALLAFAAPAVAPQFTMEPIATIGGVRELAANPQGDLFAGTLGGDVYIVTDAEGHAGAPAVFVSPHDDPAAGVAFAGNTLYVATNHAVWKIPFRSGQRHSDAAPQRIAQVRSGEPPPGSDGDVHDTTSVAADDTHVYASVGSSCNACVETDPTRATVGEVRGGKYSVIAHRIRNAIALAIDDRGHLWASDAGQDELPPPHPYEFIDDVSARRAPVDYGWPDCYENHRLKPGVRANCSSVAIPAVLFPAYETPIGAVFYPLHPRGKYAFSQAWRGGAFVTLHGSWHGPAQGVSGYLPPRIVFVPMRGGRPATAPDWSDPTRQWTQFAGGFQSGGTIRRSGRPTGITVGPQGSLFFADGQTGAIYRIRPR